MNQSFPLFLSLLASLSVLAVSEVQEEKNWNVLMI